MRTNRLPVAILLHVLALHVPLLLPLPFSGHVVTDGAAAGGVEHAMMRRVAGDHTDDGALDAPKPGHDQGADGLVSPRGGIIHLCEQIGGGIGVEAGAQIGADPGSFCDGAGQGTF